MNLERLGDVVQTLGLRDRDDTIYASAARPLSPDSLVAVLPEAAATPSDLAYLLEVG